MKVHLCCGDVFLKDYLNVDGAGVTVDMVEDNPNVTTLDNYYKKELHTSCVPIVDIKFDLNDEWIFDSNSVEEFLMICAIEHLSRELAERVIDKIYDSLIPGGKFRFDFPDIRASVNDSDDETMIRLVYGSGKNEYGFHKWGYTKKTIVDVLNHGWKNIEFGDIVKHDYPMVGVTATK